MSREYYYEIHYSIPSVDGTLVHSYVLCDGDVLKYGYGANNNHIPSAKFDTEQDALDRAHITDLSNPRVVKCEYEF